MFVGTLHCHCGLCFRGTREGVLNCTESSAQSYPIGLLQHSYSSKKFESSSFLLYYMYFVFYL